MDNQEYSQRAYALSSDFDPYMHAALGITTETGEIVDLIKRLRIYGKDMDRDHMIEELGDLAWYMNLLVVTLDTTWEEVFTRNVDKLEARYPEKKFSADRALNRNVEAEYTAMRG